MSQHRWHTDSKTCPHSNEHVCPTCDFDGYYAANYPDCPWRLAEPAVVVGRPSDEEMRAYLEGEHGPPHPEAVAIIQDDLDRAIRGDSA